jgi:hypothetical protein
MGFHLPASRELTVAVLTTLLLSSSSIGCSGPSEPPKEVREFLQREETGKAKREKIVAEHKAMRVPELAKKLETDSTRYVEPFNSVAFREIASRGEWDAPDLVALVKAPNRSSLLTLLALRKADAKSYKNLDAKLRAAILVDALRTSKQFNVWGLPHLYWEDAARAVIETGAAAVPPLKELLYDQRDAPMWGSEEVVEYQRYKYKVRDYAWALLMEIRGRKPEIPTDPNERDKAISAMLKDPR